MKSTFTGSFLLGIGTVGMLDGIIFHQILQWHSIYMFTNRFYLVEAHPQHARGRPAHRAQFISRSRNF